MIPIALLLLAILGPADSGRTLPLRAGEELVVMLPVAHGEHWTQEGDCLALRCRRLSRSFFVERHRWELRTYYAAEPGKGRLRLLRARGSGPVTGEFCITVEVAP